MYKILQLIQSVFQLKWHQHIKILLQKPFQHSHNFLGDQLRTQDYFINPHIQLVSLLTNKIFHSFQPLFGLKTNNSNKAKTTAICAVLEMQKSGKKCLIFLGHFSCLKRIDYDVVPLLEGPKFTPDAGTVPIGPRGTVRFLKEMNLKN